MNAKRLRSRQAGWTLITGLVFLIVMTLLAVISLKLGNTTSQVIGNIQTRTQTEAAAQQAIETVLNWRFYDSPMAPVPAANRCDGEANKVCLDIDADGTRDIEVKIQQADSSLSDKVACRKFSPIKNGALTEQDFYCTRSSTGNTGIESVNPDDPSLCSEALFEVRAEATDLVTKAKVVIHQGVGVRTGEQSTLCP